MTLILILIIIALVAYYYYRKNLPAADANSDDKFAQIQQTNRTLASFLKNELGGQDLNELRLKLNGRTLSEILEENETWETENDTLTRTKNELEAEIISLNTAWKSRVNEKEQIIKRAKQELSEFKDKYSKKVQQLDAEQVENNKLNEKVEKLEKEIEQLRRDNG
jgi:predicted RNase H-like nuclease (RuvC/YqgF family)